VQRESKWQNHYVKTTNKSIRLGSFNISYAVINQLIFGLENIAVIYLAATTIIAGGFSVGMLFAFMAYKGQFMQKTIKLVEKMVEFKMLSLHFERLADIVLTEKEKLHPDFASDHEVKGKIVLKDVSFSYSDVSERIFDSLNMTILEGESIAISGPSGCGKTTLIKLMLGLKDTNEGTILIDDKPLEQIGRKQYRSQIAAVMQEDTLLSGTIAENIAFFEQEVDLKLVAQCAAMASIHEDIMKMPMGYNSVIGDMGSSLSGGQKQRIILARALYKKPKILFMDEATSHLDCALEKNINKAINNLKITRVIIAHRPETIASADKEIKLFGNNSPALAIS
jgi:ATP-binding cassette subfamily B protein RaxB